MVAHWTFVRSHWYFDGVNIFNIAYLHRSDTSPFERQWSYFSYKIMSELTEKVKIKNKIKIIHFTHNIIKRLKRRGKHTLIVHARIYTYIWDMWYVSNRSQSKISKIFHDLGYKTIFFFLCHPCTLFLVILIIYLLFIAIGI